MSLPADVRDALCTILRDEPESVAWEELTALNWDTFVAVARAEGVAPLIYGRLKEQACLSVLPAVARSQLTEAYHATIAQNAVLFEDLNRIVECLEQVDIPCTLLKGAALAGMLYRDITQRPMADLDLLVPLARLDEAVAAVTVLGYNELQPERAPGLDRVANRHIALVGGATGHTIVDLHWNLIGGKSDWRTPPSDWFWEQVLPWAGNGTLRAKRHGQASSFVLTPTASLLYLAAHQGLQHGGVQERLIWLYDLHLLIRVSEAQLDWQMLVDQARAFRWSQGVRVALERTQSTLGTQLPAGLLSALSEDVDKQARDLIRRRAEAAASRTVGYWGLLSSLSWPARVRFALAMVLPAPSFVRWRYKPQPAWLWPLYYLYRWLDMMWDLLRTLEGLVRRR